MGEKDDIPDRLRSGQQHHEAIDADTDAARGGHAVLERLQELCIDLLLLFTRLVLKSLALEVGVVQFRIAGGDLLAVDDELVDIDRRGVCVVESRERNEFLGNMGDKTRIDRLLLDQFLKDMLGHLELLGTVGDIELQFGAAGALSFCIESKPSRHGFLDEFAVGGAFPGAGEIDRPGDISLHIPVMHLMILASEHCGQVTDQLLDHHRH